MILKGKNNLDKSAEIEKETITIQWKFLKNMKKILKQLLKKLYDKFKKKMREILNHFRKITVKGLKNLRNKLILEKLGKN